MNILDITENGDITIDGKLLKDTVADLGYGEYATDTCASSHLDRDFGMSHYRLYQPGNGYAVVLMCGGCETSGCDDLVCKISFIGNFVIWSNFFIPLTQAHLSKIGPFLFNKDSYLKVVSGLRK